MEERVKAFFVDYKYYLFPEDCFTLDDVTNKGIFTAKRLKEENCMAPDFIYESVAEEEVVIESASRVFEVEVTLRSAEEYDGILSRHVNRVCPGCSNYTDDGDESLNGHHREMSLDGTCYLRQGKDDFWSFSQCVGYFWYRISNELNRLAACIDKGDQKKLNKILNTELCRFCPPFRFYGTVSEGKYTLCISTDMAMGMQSAVVLFAQIGGHEKSEMSQMGWQVIPGFPKEIYTYKGKLDGSTRLAAVEPAEQPNRLYIKIYHAKGDKLSAKKQEAIVQNVRDYLCAALGENVVAAILSGFVFTADKAAKGPLSDVVGAFERKSETVREDMGVVPYPMPVFYSVNRENGGTTRMFPYKDQILEGSTVAPELSFLFPEECETEKPIWLRLYSYAYLYIPLHADGQENAFETLGWYLANSDLVPQPLRDPENNLYSAAQCGVAFGEEGFFFEQIVYDEKRFFRHLRILAPVLRSYRAKVVMVNEDGVMAYDCGYTFDPVDEIQTGGAL